MPIDKPYDETIEVADSEVITTPRPMLSSRDKADEYEAITDQNQKKKRPAVAAEGKLTGSSPILTAGPSVLACMKSDRRETEKGGPRDTARASETSTSDDDEDDDDDDDDEDDDDEHTPEVIEGAYNPADYEHMIVSPEIKEMFQYIQRYVPQRIELETHLKPFIPDYIAAVGDIDAFLKVPRPDGKPDNLGLTVLDEPCANQSDPTVLDLHLRALSKQSASKQLVVRSVENAEQQPKAIDNWVKSIADLYRAKPPPNVHYTRNMPEIDSLMAEWPAKLEEKLKTLQLPTSELDCSLKDYVDIICALLDIPVYNSRIHSLHQLFSLYLEFKSSQHFNQKEPSTQMV